MLFLSSCGLLGRGWARAASSRRSQNIFGPSRWWGSPHRKNVSIHLKTNPTANKKKWKGTTNKTIASSWWCNSFARSFVCRIPFLRLTVFLLSADDNDDDKPKMGSRRRVCAHNLITVRVNSIAVNVSLLLHAFYWQFAVGVGQGRVDTSGHPVVKDFLLLQFSFNIPPGARTSKNVFESRTNRRKVWCLDWKFPPNIQRQARRAPAGRVVTSDDGEKIHRKVSRLTSPENETRPAFEHETKGLSENVRIA